MYYSVDTGPKFTGLVCLNAGGMARGRMSFRFWISCLIPEIFAMKVGSCVKSTENLAGVKFFRVGPPNFWTCIKKLTHYADHCAKFRGDRPTELGDPVSG